MSFIRDNQEQGLKIYRELSTDVSLENKATQRGCQIDSQDDTTGAYTVSNLGDEIGWVFWEKNTRAIGSWGQIIPVIVAPHAVGAAAYVRPIASTALAADSAYAQKQVVTTSTAGDATKARAIDSIVPDGSTFGFVVQCVTHNGHEFVYFPSVAAEMEIQLARVAWNYTNTGGDLSVGELVEYVSGSGTYSATGQAIWIDYNRCSCQFETAGDNTIFQVRIMAASVTRGATTRDLYEVVSCEYDGGSRISHLLKSEIAGGMIYGYILSEDLLASPWTNTTTSKVKTTILSVATDNIISTKAPADWDVGGSGAWTYTETCDFSRGFPLYVRPIDPVFTGTSKSWESDEESGGVTISTYSSVS